MSNCVFCVRRAGCTRHRLIRSLAKGLFVISGLAEESTGQCWCSEWPSCWAASQVSNQHPSPFVLVFLKFLFVLLLQTEAKDKLWFPVGQES